MGASVRIGGEPVPLGVAACRSWRYDATHSALGEECMRNATPYSANVQFSRRRALSIVWIVSIVCAGSCGPLAAQVVEPVRIGVDDANPPFMFARNGLADGVYPAVVRSAFERMGVVVVTTAMPWKRVLFEVDHGTSGVAGIYKTEERSRRLDFSDPIVVENIAVYFNQAKPIAFRSIDDLNGLTVGVIRGWSYGDAFDAARAAGRFRVDEAVSDRSSLLKLASGRVDVVLAIWEAGQAAMASERLGNIGAAGVFLTSNPAYLAFHKSSRQGDLLERFNRTLADMKRDGSLRAIMAQEVAR